MPAVNDTHPDIERKRIELLRRMSPDQRGKLGSQLSNQARWRAERAIESANPTMTEQDRKLLFVRMHYGSDLADRVRAYVAERHP